MNCTWCILSEQVTCRATPYIISANVCLTDTLIKTFCRNAGYWSNLHVCGIFSVSVPMTLRPQLSATASAKNILNINLPGSMPLDSTGIPEKPRQRWKLEATQTGDFSSRSQFTLSICLGLPGLSRGFPHCLTQLTTRCDQSTALLLFLTMCPRHAASDQMINQSLTLGLECTGTRST